MANYTSVKSILSSTENLTVVRNNSQNNSGVDTITGVDWFSYQGTVCSNFYVSGDSWIGLGSSVGHLQVNNRDCASYYVWREEGTLDNFFKFLRIRWQGYSRYGKTSSSYLLAYDVIFWDTGDISLHMVNVPTSYYTGTFTLGDLAYTAPTTELPDVTFKLQKYGYYLAEYSLIDISRKPHLLEGSCEFTVREFKNVTSFLCGTVNAQIEMPEGTSVDMFLKANDGEYVEYQNGTDIPCFEMGSDICNCSLSIKFVLRTNDEFLTPSIKGLEVILRDTIDEHVVLLILGSGNVNSMQNAVGDVTVSYDGSGSLMGLGGPVAAFEETFSPVDLINKINPMDAEHIELAEIIPIGSLKKVYYMNAKTQEHVELVNIVPTGVLTKIDDI